MRWLWIWKAKMSEAASDTDVINADGILFPNDPRIISDRIAKRLERGGYEEREANAVRQVLRRGDRVLELGGGIGFISSLIGTSRPPSEFHVYEGNPQLVPFIRQVHALNGLDNISVHNTLLSVDATDDVPFYLREDFLGSSMDRDNDPDTIIDTVMVPQKPFADVIETLQPTFLVCDIEGAESTILPSADLSCLRAAVVELHPQWTGQDGVQAVFDAFQNAGLTYFARTSHGKVVTFKKRG